jgi:PAS domain S-box-containing protein
MSSAVRQGAARRLAQLEERILELWQERAALSDPAADSIRPLTAALARALEAGEPLTLATAQVADKFLRGRTPAEEVSAIARLQEIVLRVLEREEPLTFAERMAVLAFFEALRIEAANEVRTRQQQLAQAATRSEERYLAAARAAGFAIWDWDLRGESVHWNQHVEALFGYPVEALSSLESWLEYVHPTDRERVGQSLRQAVESGLDRWSEAFQFLRRDGTYASVLGRAWVSHDATGNPVRLVGGLIDVSEQRRAERRLEEQMLLTRTVAENAASCLFLLDRRGCATYMNPAATRLTGYTLEEIRDTRFYSLMNPALQHSTSLIEDCPVHRREVAFRDHDCTFVRKDGTPFPVACTLTPLFESDAGGAVLELCDLTELRRSQAELREAVRVRDDFLSIASHELRTPMSALRMYIQGLIKGPLFEPLDERVKSRLLGADRSTLRMIQLLNELLDVSRLNTAHLELELADVNLTAVIQEVVDRLQPDISRSNSTLSLALASDVIGHWDRSRLDQVISNLLSNALKYGEGKPIEISLEEHDARALLRVRDHGVGIAPSEHERIFERFQRAASQRHYGGFGLGLWIAKRVLGLMGGTIRVESEFGNGALFEVCLPRHPPAKASREEGPPDPAAASGGDG